MDTNRLPFIAAVLITLGMAGILVTGRLGTYPSSFRMPPMMDIRPDGRMMMNQQQMRGMMQDMMAGLLPPGIRPEDLPDPRSEGAGLVARYCSQCHHLPSPQMRSAEEWPVIADRMFHRMEMMAGRGGMRMMNIESPSPEERTSIVAYLKAHALKPVAPEAIPSPRSRGASLFRNVCSQCHPLPDPGLHTADEWPGIVDRMQAHMGAMGKRAVTDQEKREIVDYLRDNASRS
ncbi:MAG: c-type cytochrome [Alphaproteobacteria bacterium]|uniref:C-type cytochrome n=1 Tax=Candidatus Nitrobium versatile TaxID=2884831 RepID=A0A953J3K3_9BACT|nr:c-type cytochrome [Candidatus Nitrobium versatile]